MKRRTEYPPGYPPPDPLRLDFHKLRIVRKSLDISQIELSRRCGVTDASVGYWEHGTAVPTIVALIRAGRVLGTPIFDLFDVIEEPRRNQ
jgi:transcriptional regulator with XRE-family HTH domain